MRIALVCLVHGDRSVAEHGLWTRGCNRDELIYADHRITNLPKLAGNIFVLDFEIRNRRLAAWAPVDDVFAAINQPVFMQPDEHFPYSAGKVFVHGEVFATPIYSSPKTFHLLLDGAAI